MINVRNTPVLTDPVEIATRLSKDSVIAYDCETTGLSPYKDKIALMQFYGEDTGTLGVVQIKNGVVPDIIRGIFKHGPKFIVHNGVNFDLQFLQTHGINWRQCNWYDTLVGETVVSGSNKRSVRVSLKDSARRRLDIEVDKSMDHSWNVESLTDRQVEYAATDVLLLPPLWRSQLSAATDSKQERALDMEMQVMPVFARMTYNGVPLKPFVLREYVGDERRKMDKLKLELSDALGNINLGSVKQVKEAFKSKLGVQLMSTAAEALGDHIQLGLKGSDVCRLLLEYRHAAQRVKMYSDDWIAEHVVDNKVHPRFWQCSTDTGRVSCSGPNLQQVPRDGRKVFGNIDGITMVSCDYSQIEVRIASWIAKDAVMNQMLEQDDIHTAVAASIFNKPQSEVTKAERSISKACSFTLLFGGGANKLYDYARLNGSDVSLKYMKEVVAKFFMTFKGIHAMKMRAIKMADQQGPVTIRMPNGFRRVLVGHEKTLTRILNTSVQGSAAVGLKYALIEADRRGLGDYIVATVHDEIVAAVPDAVAGEVKRELADSMVYGMKQFMDTTVLVEAKSGSFWQS